GRRCSRGPVLAAGAMVLSQPGADPRRLSGGPARRDSARRRRTRRPRGRHRGARWRWSSEARAPRLPGARGPEGVFIDSRPARIISLHDIRYATGASTACSHERLSGPGGISPSTAPLPPLRRAGGRDGGSRAAAAPAHAGPAGAPAGRGRHRRRARRAAADPTPQRGRAHRPDRGPPPGAAWTGGGRSPAGHRAPPAPGRGGPLAPRTRPPHRAAHDRTGAPGPARGARAGKETEQSMTRKVHDRLGDFTVTLRLVPISLLAVAIAVLSAFVALVLLRLIG